MKRFCAASLVFFLIFSSLNPASFASSKKSSQKKSSQKKISVTASAAIVVDISRNKVIYAKNIHTKYAPASTVKLLTALLALEKLGADTEVIISKNASSVEPTKLYLKQGAMYNSLDLIKAVLMSSANDASIALAEAVSGSEDDFSEMMNRKAKSLEASNSNFKSASGLPEINQYSTAYDLYQIIKAALKNSVIYQIMKDKKEVISDNLGRKTTLVNHNKMLFRKTYPIVLGKTGYTKNARHCYAGIAYFKNKKYAIVILKSQKHWDDIEKLLKFVKE